MSRNNAAAAVVSRYLKPVPDEPRTVWCIPYLRLSDGRNENGTFEEREASLRAKAKQLGWEVLRVVRENDEIANGARSASAFKRKKIRTPDGRVKLRVYRPGYRSILADIAAGRAQAILAEDLDRAMRDPRDLEDLIEAVELWGAQAESLTGKLRFTPGPDLNMQINMARYYVNRANEASRETAERVARGRARVAGRGQWGGGRRPYGFTPVPQPTTTHQNTILQVCEDEAAVIRWAVEKFLPEKGVQVKALARDLRARGVATVTGVPWSAKTLRDILLRPLNAGIMVYAGQMTEVRLEGEPILEYDVWQAVVEKLSDPGRVTTSGRAPCWLGTNIYLCVCGSVMEIQAGTKRAQAYRCARKGGRGDAHVRRSAGQLDAFIAAAVCERLSQPDAVGLLAPRSHISDAELLDLRKQAASLRSRKQWLAAQLGAGDMDEIEFAAAKRANEAKLSKIEQKLAAVTEYSPLVGLVGADDVEAAWDRLPLGQQRAIVSKLVTVTVLPTTGPRRNARVLDENCIRLDWRAGRPNG